MAKYIDDDCVGCERCINCGRGEYIYYECDACDKSTLNGDTLYKDGDKHYCLGCLVRQNLNDFLRYAIPEVGKDWADANYYEVKDGED